MSALLDDISRIIASPIPRRQALRLLGGVVGGGVLTYLGRASRGLGAPAGGAQQGGSQKPEKCGHNQFLCPDNKTCCTTGQTCCNGKCCPDGQSCCGSRCCARGTTCCNATTCCGRGQTCCGTGKHSVCCGEHYTCCTTKSGTAECCAPAYYCCNHKCVKAKPSGASPCAAG
jgi:hypothetical protein